VGLRFVHDGAWTLSVVDGDRQERLRRALTASSCVEAADAAAIIVERYLVSVAWRGSEARLRPIAPPPVAAASVAPAPVAPPAAVEPTAPSEPSQPWFRRPEVALGPAVVLGVHGLVAGGSLQAAVRVRAVRAGLWLGGTVPEPQDVLVANGTLLGKLSMNFAFAYATGSGCLTLGPLEACVGAALGAALAYGTVSGNIHAGSPTALAPLALGGVVRLAYASPVGFTVALDALGGAPVRRPSFSIENYPTTLTFPVPAAEAVAALHAGWAF